MTIRVPRKPANAYQHGNLREALVQAGLKLLAEGGVENLSLRAAAQLAGVSHAAPYRHFADKDALVAAIGEQGFRLLTASMRAEEAKLRPGPGGNSVRERLMALGRGYLSFARKYPAYLHVIFGGARPHGFSTPELQAAGQEAYHVLRDTVVEGIAGGELVAADPDLLSLAFWSNIHGLSHLIVNRAIPPPTGEAAADALADALARLIGEGLYAVP